MIVKEIINEEMITLAEAKGILLDIKEKRLEEDMELGYELRRAINHAELFSKTDGPKSRGLVEKLLQLEKMKPEKNSLIFLTLLPMHIEMWLSTI